MQQFLYIFEMMGIRSFYVLLQGLLVIHGLRFTLPVRLCVSALCQLLGEMVLDRLYYNFAIQ